MADALNWFEVPVADLQRAKKFYETILQTPMAEEEMNGMRFVIFPHDEGRVGGALIAGEGYAPGDQGPVIYLNAGEDLAPVLDRVETAGGSVTMPKTFLSDEIGHIAMFTDIEGNRMALHSFK